ncbi:MAG: elongation factor P hydroxylase [Pseudomonadales bacterium]
MFDLVAEFDVAEHDSVGHYYKDLIRLFNHLFGELDNTRLVLGESEPIYLPANNDCPYHQVIFAHGFFSSALHEIAHWCIAGQQRRQQVDYGYWYAADGRDRKQQAEFEQVEVKPQALEWILSRACQKCFRVSVDNLHGEATDSAPFKWSVHQQVLVYCQRGLPTRAALLHRRLSEFYQVPSELLPEYFQLAELG